MGIAYEIHSKIAADVWANGGTLRCLKCGHVETFTTDQAARYLGVGWPRHCDSAMLSSGYDAELAAVMNQDRALNELLQERKRQDAKWGEQNHDDYHWLAILMEEIGEVSQAMLHSRFGGPHAGTERTELVQVAAVAVQWLECMGRRETAVCQWTWSGGYWETSCVSDKYFSGEKEGVKSCHNCERPVVWKTAVPEENSNETT